MYAKDTKSDAPKNKRKQVRLQCTSKVYNQKVKIVMCNAKYLIRIFFCLPKFLVVSFACTLWSYMLSFIFSYITCFVILSHILMIVCFHFHSRFQSYLHDRFQTIVAKSLKYFNVTIHSLLICNNQIRCNRRNLMKTNFNV